VKSLEIFRDIRRRNRSRTTIIVTEAVVWPRRDKCCRCSKPMNFFTAHSCAAMAEFPIRERIEHGAKARRQRPIWCTIRSVETGKGMRDAVALRATLDRLVGMNQVLPRQREYASAGVDQRSNVAFVLVRNAECEPVDLHPTCLGKVKTHSVDNRSTNRFRTSDT